MRSSRRRLVKLLGAGVTAPWLAGCVAPTGSPLSRVRSRARVVIIGGGFAGVTVARELKAAAPNLSVALIEPKRRYVACPFSNLVIAGLRSLEEQTFSYAALQSDGIYVVHDSAVAVDYDARTVRLAEGDDLPFDRLEVTPGIELDYDALSGYDAAAAEVAPHAWQAGPQTLLLRRQLEAMPDGGVVAMAIPDNPYRCPPGPYERASLIAWYLKQHKPRAKLLLLDAKDRFSKQPLFEQAWQQEYGELLSWQGRSDGAAVTRVDAQTQTLYTDFDSVRADVLNVIPPQRAGAIARQANLVDESGWCPVDAASFESLRQAGTYVLGDAAIANAMPKSAFAANAQGRHCAAQVLRNLAGEPPLDGKLLNTCYSLVRPGYGISVAGVYEPAGEFWQEIDGAGGASPVTAPARQRSLEAEYAAAWFDHLTGSLFGR